MRLSCSIAYSDRDRINESERLKILRPLGRAGSTPAVRTNARSANRRNDRELRPGVLKHPLVCAVGAKIRCAPVVWRIRGWIVQLLIDTHRLQRLAGRGRASGGGGGPASQRLRAGRARRERGMRTFWDQVVALVEQGDRPQGAREARLIGHESAMPQVGARSAALKAQCEDIGRSLDHLERLRGLFQSFLSPVSELVLEFEACNGRLEETTAKLAALEEAHRDLAARHAAALEDRDRLLPSRAGRSLKARPRCAPQRRVARRSRRDWRRGSTKKQARQEALKGRLRAASGASRREIRAARFDAAFLRRRARLNSRDERPPAPSRLEDRRRSRSPPG